MRRRSTITEEFSPTLRRRLTTNYLNISTPTMEFDEESEFQEILLKSRISQIIEQSENIGTNGMLKKAERHFQSFVENHEKIGKIIDEVDMIMRKRMEYHEVSLIDVVRKELDTITQDARKIVEAYNMMIESKNKQSQIYSLQNELAYFQNQSKKLFEENKALTQQNKELRSLVNKKDQIIFEVNGALRKSTKKYLKQRVSSLHDNHDKQTAQKQIVNMSLSKNKQDAKNVGHFNSSCNHISTSLNEELSNKKLSNYKRLNTEDKSNNRQTIKKDVENRYYVKTRKNCYTPNCQIDPSQIPMMDKMMQKQKYQQGSVTQRYKKSANAKIDTKDVKRRLMTEMNMPQFQRSSNFYNREENREILKKRNLRYKKTLEQSKESGSLKGKAKSFQKLNAK